MKYLLISYLTVFAFSVGSVRGQEGGGGCDCTRQIEEHLKPVIEQRDVNRRDVDTLLQQRDQLIKERDTYFHEKEEIVRVSGSAVEMKRHLDEHREAVSQLEIEKRRLVEELNEQKAIVERSSTDREHFQKVAQENQHYMQEYKVRLATMRDKSAKLDLELENAYSKIKELESATLVTKIKKELAAGYESLLMLMGKHKEETSQDL